MALARQAVAAAAGPAGFGTAASGTPLQLSRPALPLPPSSTPPTSGGAGGGSYGLQEGPGGAGGSAARPSSGQRQTQISFARRGSDSGQEQASSSEESGGEDAEEAGGKEAEEADGEAPGGAYDPGSAEDIEAWISSASVSTCCICICGPLLTLSWVHKHRC